MKKLLLLTLALVGAQSLSAKLGGGSAAIFSADTINVLESIASNLKKGCSGKECAFVINDKGEITTLDGSPVASVNDIVKLLIAAQESSVAWNALKQLLQEFHLSNAALVQLGFQKTSQAAPEATIDHLSAEAPGTITLRGAEWRFAKK